MSGLSAVIGLGLLAWRPSAVHAIEIDGPAHSIEQAGGLQGGGTDLQTPDNEARRPLNRTQEVRSGGVGFSPTSAAASLLPENLRGLRWRIYERLGKVPRPQGYTAAHGYGDMASGEGIAVGFLSALSGRNGHCSISESPATPGNSPGCSWNAWISEKPGGPPMMGICIQAGGRTMGSTVNWASTPQPFGKYMCELKPSTVYYCNVAGCRGLIGSPLGVDDYTREEALRLNTGKPCNLPGSPAQGVFGPDGVCRCQDARCEELYRIYPTLPRCTNQVMRMNNVCYSCTSLYPAACGSPNQVVEDCGMTCRP